MKTNIFVYRHNSFILVLFFLIGIFVTEYSFYPIQSTSLIVVFYTFILLITQNYYQLSLSQNAQDSPYILGFLFTLISIYYSFSSLSVLNTEESSKVVKLIFSNFGVALFTTIAGLIGRHVLKSYDPDLKRKKDRLEDMMETLQDGADKFIQSHENFLSLIDRFNNTYSDILDEEESVSIKHIEKLSEVIEKLNSLEVRFPQGIDDLLTQIDTLSNEMRKISSKTLPDTKNDITDIISNLTNEINKQLSSINAKNIKDINEIIVSSIENINEQVNQVTTCSKESLNSIVPINNNVISNIEKVNKIIEEEGLQILSNLKKFKNNINEIDTIFLEVTKLLKNRLKKYE